MWGWECFISYLVLFLNLGFSDDAERAWLCVGSVVIFVAISDTSSISRLKSWLIEQSSQQPEKSEYDMDTGIEPSIADVQTLKRYLV